MRLKPAPTAGEALRLLTVNAVLSWGAEDLPAMAPHLTLIAEAMAVVAALDIDDDVEPLFGEDIASDPVEFAPEGSA